METPNKLYIAGILKYLQDRECENLTTNIYECYLNDRKTELTFKTTLEKKDVKLLYAVTRYKETKTYLNPINILRRAQEQQINLLGDEETRLKNYDHEVLLKLHQMCDLFDEIVVNDFEALTLSDVRAMDYDSHFFH